jgi:hypothetical protein
MHLTRAEITIIIIAIILIVFYIFTVNKETEAILSYDNIEDMDNINNINNEKIVMKMTSTDDGYDNLKRIIDVNYYTVLNKSNIELWIPFFASDISLNNNDINKIKTLSEPENIFIQILYPKIFAKSIDLIDKLVQFQLYFTKNKIIEDSFNIYINYIKEYNIYYMNMKFNLINKEILLDLKNKEDKVIKIHDLLLNSLK